MEKTITIEDAKSFTQRKDRNGKSHQVCFILKKIFFNHKKK